jgi:hypothetical protein
VLGGGWCIVLLAARCSVRVLVVTTLGYTWVSFFFSRVFSFGNDTRSHLVMSSI